MWVYVFEFDIVPGKETAFWKFMEEEGTPFWLQFSHVKKYEVFSKIGGHCAYEGHVEFDNLAEFSEIWAHPGLKSIIEKTNSYTQNIQRRFTRLEKSYAKK